MASFGAAKRLDPNKAGSLANKYATGSRIYNGTSPSPQFGTGSVNPAGYLQRDKTASVKRNLLLKQASRGR
jgi:hypothetical protein